MTNPAPPPRTPRKEGEEEAPRPKARDKLRKVKTAANAVKMTQSALSPQRSVTSPVSSTPASPKGGETAEERHARV